MDSNSVLMVIGGLVLVAGVISLSSKKSKKPTNTQPQTDNSPKWFFGPLVKGKNYSKGMPESPTPQGTGWTMSFPDVNGEVDAVVNFNPPSLVGAKGVTLHYSVTGSGFLASTENNVPGRVGIVLQRKGDNWSGSGQYQQYRLYGQSRPLLVAGDNQQVVATVWTDVMGQVASQTVVDTVFANLDNVAVCFGGSFASHGVFVTQPSTFTLKEFEVLR